MLRIFHEKEWTWYQFFWLSVLFAGLLYSGIILIISMIMLLLPSFFTLTPEGTRIDTITGFFYKVKQFVLTRNYVLITLFFWVSFFSVFNSEDLGTWRFFTTMKLPFLLFTFAMFNIRRFSKVDFQRLLVVYILILFLSSFGVLTHFFDGLDSLSSIIDKGKSVPTPVDHIKYSLFLSFGIITGIIVFNSKTQLFFRGEKWVLGVLLFYLFVFIHLIAVRSGIVVLYVNLIVYFFSLLRKQGKYLLSMVIISLILAIPFTAYYTIPTFRAKVEYSIRDFKMASQDKGRDYSDGERIRSYELGWKLFKRSPITGIGVGDIFNEYAALYKQEFSSKSPTMLPHNQFLSVAVSTGIIGLLVFCLGFFFPFGYRDAWKDPFLKSLFLLMFLSFLVENTLERQYSVAFYLVFLLLGLNQLFKNEKYPLPGTQKQDETIKINETPVEIL